MSSIQILFVFVPVLAVILLALNVIFAVHNPDSEKVSSYECGFTGNLEQTRNPFNVQFYIVAMLFLIFDLEIVILYPITTTLYSIESYGLFIALIFFGILTIGFIYEFGSGVLKNFSLSSVYTNKK